MHALEIRLVALVLFAGIIATTMWQSTTVMACSGIPLTWRPAPSRIEGADGKPGLIHKEKLSRVYELHSIGGNPNMCISETKCCKYSFFVWGRLGKRATERTRSL